MWSITPSIKLKIAIRGYGNHAKRIEKILKLNKIETYQISRNFFSNEIRENTQGLIICSPNFTHKKYIEKSLNYNPEIPIYCEKPIFNHNKDFIDIVKFIKTGKIFPGFNLRRSEFKDFFHSYKKKLGNTKSLLIRVSYPFGLKESYLNSWKSNYELSSLGVMENLSIHFIDLAYYLLGEEEQRKIFLSDFLNSVPRNCDVLIKHKNGSITSIHNSYSEVLNSQLIINFDRGKIVIDDNATSIYSPTLNLDIDKDFCMESPLIANFKKNFEEIFSDSLKNSVELFIENIKKGKIHNIDDSCSTTMLTIKAMSEIFNENIINL